jgi:hypothetical protein
MWQRDKSWEETYREQIVSILSAHVSHLVEITLASAEMDKHYATDYEVKVVGGTIAVRLRRSKYQYRDLTIRSRRDSGMKTELAKIKEGAAFRYFYGWTDEKRTIAEWILVDLDKVRATGLLEKPRREWPNGDGTYFIAIPVTELKEAGCLLASRICKAGEA